MSTGSGPTPLADVRALQAAIARHATLAALHASPEWPALRERLARVAGAIRRYRPAADAAPAPGGTFRVAHWNIEHGNQYAQVERALREHPALAGAGLVLLNEVDVGMARAGNRDVAADLAQALGMHGAWAPLFLESTVGRDDDALTADGRANQESLFGLAILSRWPLARVRVVPLPGPEQVQYDVERMLGRFAALVAEVAHPDGAFLAVAVHLEVHRTRAHRAEQMRALLAGLTAERLPVVLAGDWNTHTFDRGLWHSPVSGALPLLTWPTRALRARLLRPDRGRHREPLFDVLRDAGFDWSGSVDDAPTLRLRFERLDEWRAWPAAVRGVLAPLLAWAERRGTLRLDWIATRGIAASAAATLPGLDGPGAASDHAPIVATLHAGAGGAGPHHI